MSLINEALKKAQRDRHLDSLPPMPGGGGRMGRRRGMSTQTLVLIGSGIFVLFVLSVVAAVFLINRQPSSPVKTTVAAKPTIKLADDSPASTPMIVVPLSTKPSPSPATAAPSPVPTPAALVVVAAPTAAPAPTPSPLSNTVSVNLGPTRPPSVSEKFDPRLQALVDSWKVTAVRSSGSESKLFMNGSVFRVEDVIDRVSGLRLTKVSTTSLTFTDAEGLTYAKRY